MMLLWGLWPMPALYVVNETRRHTIARWPVRDSASVRLHYVHSIYQQPAVEEFDIRPTGFELVRLASPSVAVLEYYARPEPITAADDGYAVRLSPQVYSRLSLLVGNTGRRTLSYGGRELPLYQAAADGDRISLVVQRTPRVALAW
jgi:hypothetical protein